VKGKVISIASVSCRVDTADGIYECAARRRLTESDTGQTKPFAVGDEVILEPTGPREGVVTEVLPRRTRLSRAQPHDRRAEHVVVANVDQLLIVCSVREPPLTVGIIDRYIIAAQSGGIEPVVCINKIDLAPEPVELVLRSEPQPRKVAYEDIAALYSALGFRVRPVSARTGAGVEELKADLIGRTTVLAGHSGVGKSSLINAIQPGLKLKTGTVTRRGRHITANVSLLKLQFGAYVVDTPGVREFSLWDIKKRDVAEFFPDIWDLAPNCKMSDCSHVHEPDCAVKRALERGELSRIRYDSYVGILESVGHWSVPRETDVERPREQIARSKRNLSRSTRKQQLKERWRAQLGEDQ